MTDLRPARGLVIGKFWPPHRGHAYLIEEALAGCRELTVAVCDHPAQSPPPATLRAAWLREMFPAARVVLVRDLERDDDSQAWADYVPRCLGWTPDVVFSSEPYGPVFARLMGAAHRSVDPERTLIPCSGTQVRACPSSAWDFLTPPARAWYVVRICALGAESTGTTTLARDLAEHLETAWVPEYGRDYWVEKMERGHLDWSSDEFLHIAREQARREDTLAREARRILVCDTDAFTTTVWHERYVGTPHPEVENLAEQRRAPGTAISLYLLTPPDVPFEQDGTRDGEHIRDWMQQRFIERLEATSRPWIQVSGSRLERVEQAVRAIRRLGHCLHGRPSAPGRQFAGCRVVGRLHGQEVVDGLEGN